MKKIYIILIFTLLFLYGCVLGNLTPNRPIGSLIVIDSLSVDFPIDKVSYSPIDKTFFLLNKQDNSVHLYKNGIFFNIIGGSGFSVDNFRRLSDICFGNDGFFYALDSFDKSFKKFDTDGKYIGSANLNNFSSPEKFAMTRYGAFFVYDGHTKEISNLDPFDYSIKYTFGRFQIDNADEMFLAGDYLNIFDVANHNTNIFFINGMLENSYNGYIFYDAYQNTLQPMNNYIIDRKNQNFLFSIKNPGLPTRKRDDLIKINIENNLLILYHNDQIFALRINYETK